MQISDLYSQYSKNTGQQVNAANVVQADKVATLNSTVSKLPVGSIFEGNVAKLSGGNVLLSLSNGQSLTAHLDNSLKLVQGQTMFFQVKSNDGQTIAIKPYTGGHMDNPIIKSALETAGVPINDRTTEMVNAMMKERMPINSEALSDMYKTLVTLSDRISVDTAVTMSKLSIPITPENASQFENYVNDSGEILKQMESFFEELPQFLSNEEFSAPKAIGVNHELLSIITEGMPDEPVIMPEDGVREALPQEAFAFSEDADTAQEATVKNPAENVAQSADMKPADMNAPEQTGVVSRQAGQQEPVMTSEVPIKNGLLPEEPYERNQLGAIFKDPSELEELSDNLRMIGDLSDNEMLFDQDGNINKNLTAKQLLSIADTELLKNAGKMEKEDVTELIGSKEYRKLLQNVMEEQWMLKPEDVRDKEAVKEMYSKLDRQLSHIEKLADLTGQNTNELSQTASQIRDNMSFINDLNQMYTYAQIPLKMSGQNANGDLYVYTNKKHLMDPEGELSAFLHLDMEHLGSTDVSVHMLKKKVTTDFFMKDDVSFKLIMEHMGELKARLDALGFDAEINVSNDEKPVSFVKDFLEKDMPKAHDMVHRYSFDVRA